MKLARQGMPLLICLQALMGHFGKDYVFPSQAEICRRLRDWYSVELSRRQVNRVLLALEVGGMISRTRRHKRDKRRGMLFRSTLYHIGLRGWRLLYSWGAISRDRFLAMTARIRCYLNRGVASPGAPVSREGVERVMGLVGGFLRGSS